MLYKRSYNNKRIDMEESRTWRDLLARIINDPQEKRRIADALGVNPTTLVRWVRGDATPRQQSLQGLLEVVPQYRTRLLPLIAQAFDEFSPAGASPESIPVTLYNRVLHLLCTTSYERRFWSICSAVLHDALKRLDPDRLGLQLNIEQCMAPAYGNTVRCLRERLALGTPPWSEQVEQRGRFLGAESLAGFVTSIGRQYTIVNTNKEHRLPDHLPEHAMSAVATPIMYVGRVAACLLVVSTQPGYFRKPALLDLIQSYALLLVLAFHPEDFYELERIELQLMPSFQVQQSYFSSIQQRILGLLKKAAIDHRPLSYDVAEQHALWQVEEELLQLSTSPSPEE